MMSKGMSFILAGMMIVAGAVQAGEKVSPSQTRKGASLSVTDKGWKPLFKSDLSDATFDKGVWSFDQDGVLIPSKDKLIWTKREYENFVLELDYKLESGANSGVIIYCTKKSKWVWNSIEVQLLDDAHKKWARFSKNYRNGGLFGLTVPFPGCSVPVDTWAHLKITAKGQHIVVEVNGKVSADADLSKMTSTRVNPDKSRIPGHLGPRPRCKFATKGLIGLQGKHGGVGVCFRSVKIREL